MTSAFDDDVDPRCPEAEPNGPRAQTSKAKRLADAEDSHATPRAREDAKKRKKERE